MFQAIDPTEPMHAIYWVWVLWYASWLISLAWTSKATAEPQKFRHIPHALITVAGVFLLFDTGLLNTVQIRLWTLPDAVLWGLTGLVALAFAFCWWARIEMGRLWSGMVSRTENHRVIDTGPFALVRHPIYAGVTLAAFLTATAQGRLLGFAGAGCMLLGFWLKARIEERFLARELGEEAYGPYRARVPMLIPFTGG
jgi:protein-S-isoprenylcysteine O-methyltransferase Ste14